MANNKPHTRAATMPAAAVDWSSLSAELVSCVGDIFLAYGDVDYYISLRAVCRSWRAATVDPGGPDQRFTPRGWAMLEPIGTKSDTGRCVFLHVRTRRLLSKDLSMLRDYICLTSTTDSLLVLQNLNDGLKMCVLNPFTGHQVAHFLLTPKFAQHLGSSVVVAAGPSPVLYTFRNSRPIAYIDTACGRESKFTVEQGARWFSNVVVFQGRVYGTDYNGSVIVVEDHSRGDKEPVLTTIVTADSGGSYCPSFLVDNGGELLLVRLQKYANKSIHVFKVNIENKTLEKIRCIGNRAIFLAPHCLSVAVDNLPAIAANCIYYVIRSTGDYWLYIYRLEDDNVEIVDEPHMYSYVRHYGPQSCFGPMSLAGYILQKRGASRVPN